MFVIVVIIIPKFFCKKKKVFFMRIQITVKQNLSELIIDKCNALGIEINQYILLLILNDLTEKRVEKNV